MTEFRGLKAAAASVIVGAGILAGIGVAAAGSAGHGTAVSTTAKTAQTGTNHGQAVSKVARDSHGQAEKASHPTTAKTTQTGTNHGQAMSKVAREHHGQAQKR